MRSPAPNRSKSRDSPRADAAAASTNQMQEEGREALSSGGPSLALEKTEEQEQELQRSPARPAASGATEEDREKQWETESREQLLERTRCRIRRSSLQHQHVYFRSADAALMMQQTSGDGFAEEIESEAAEIRTLIARTAQLWSAVDRAERADDLPEPLQLQTTRSLSVSALQTRRASLPAQYVCAEGDNTLSSDGEEYSGEEEDDTETESIVDVAIQQQSRDGGYATDDELFVAPLRHYRSPGRPMIDRSVDQRRFEHDEINSDDGNESEGSEEDGYEMGPEFGGVHAEQGEIRDASNRAINVSKARAIKSAMIGNLTRLGFRDDITRAALEAGVLEIDHYDFDCELAYVDIFMSLVKMVCDAHVEVVNEHDDIGQDWVPPGDEPEDAGILDANVAHSLEQRSFLPFKWPVFDMAQFEFGNARPGTCFNSVCVLTNLPKVSMDRTEELMEILSCSLFCMIGDPIQVVIPSASSTGRTKGHAFLEFDDPDMAKRCAAAVDGLTWGRGPFGRIRGNLFRQYQVKSPAEEQRRASPVINDGASFPRSFSRIPVAGSVQEGHNSTYERRGNGLSRRRFQPGMDRSDVLQEQNFYCESDDDSSDGGEWVVSGPLEYAPFNPSSLLDLSSGSVDIRDQTDPSQHNSVEQQVGWDDEALGGNFAVRLSSEEEEGIEYDDSFDSNIALELQAPDEETEMDPSLFVDLVGERRYSDSRCSPARVSLSSNEAQAESSTSAASAAAREALADCGMVEQPWIASQETENGVEKPWRRYCEELIVRDREMQDQVSFARRRIAQLSHNNRKLHLLIDRVERDRDGLLFENDLLQTQLHGYEDHEQHHDSMMEELIVLRKRLTQKEQLDPHHRLHTAYASANVSNPPASFQGARTALSQLSSLTLGNCKMEELKDWEQLLESTLSHVRSVKEEKAIEMQKKLDRQVEEQNELKLCVICLSNEKSILCLPCRHLCLCKTCSRRQEVTKCPICRLEIEEMLAVYS